VNHSILNWNNKWIVWVSRNFHLILCFFQLIIEYGEYEFLLLLLFIELVYSFLSLGQLSVRYNFDSRHISSITNRRQLLLTLLLFIIIIQRLLDRLIICHISQLLHLHFFSRLLQILGSNNILERWTIFRLLQIKVGDDIFEWWIPSLLKLLILLAYLIQCKLPDCR